MKILMILLVTLGLSACTVDPEPAPPPKAPAAADRENYVGKDTIYDTQFKALHDAKQLGAQMNEEAARLDEKIEASSNPPSD